MIYLVVPCYNEQAVLESSDKQLQSILTGLPADIKILYVDDGSTDKTWSIIQANQRTAPDIVHGIRLAHNVGHQTALLAGIETCVDMAEAIITLDADLQDDIQVIPRMIEDFYEGIDVVYGVRRARTSDAFLKRWTAQVFYRLQSLMGCDTIFNHADFRLMSQRAAKALLSYPERNLYLRGLVPLLGFHTKIEYYDRLPRMQGNTKYPVRKMMALALDGITSFTTRPLHWILIVGFVFVLISLCVIVWALVSRLKGRTIEGWTSLLISVWFVGGCLLLALGIIGEYIGKVYAESKHRPRYHVMETTY